MTSENTYNKTECFSVFYKKIDMYCMIDSWLLNETERPRMMFLYFIELNQLS